MKPLTALLIGAWLIVASCVKTDERPKENFKFIGTVTDCDGKPVKDALVTAEARELTWVVDPVDKVGIAYTNANGYYEITPEQTDMFYTSNTVRHVYRIRAELTPYREQHETIRNDSIRQAQADFYTIDITLCD